MSSSNSSSPTTLLNTDRDLATAIMLKPIKLLAEQKLGIPSDAITTYGDYKAKVLFDSISSNLDDTSKNGPGKLVLVTGVSPTPAGEGKTTTTIGLTDALMRRGVHATACLREPSLGPCFGMKGGAHGGGLAQVAPMEDINLHFNGDLHAVTAANNLLASLVDNHLYWDNPLDIDPLRIAWRRVLDINDRALRNVDISLRGNAKRQSGFNITAASEIMAILCLAENRRDLQDRLRRTVIGHQEDGSVVTAGDLHADGALTVLLNDALNPNVVQTLEHNPVFVHGGPFANIAHGCSSVIATKAALNLCKVVVTEAGFGADLGAEKFFNIKCRQSGLSAGAAVLVCTVRSLKMHGGVSKDNLTESNVSAVYAGSVNLRRHIENTKQFGLLPVVALNRFSSDTDDEVEAVKSIGQECGVHVCVATHWKDGGVGAEELAEAVMDSLASKSTNSCHLYPDDFPLRDKIKTVATHIYRANQVTYDPQAADELAEFEKLGYGHLPICIAKTQYSFSADPNEIGAPEKHTLPVREVRLSAGAGFVVVICGNMMTMPGLPRRPAALDFGFDDQGGIVGLR